MTVSISAPVPVGSDSYRVAWASDLPGSVRFYLYQDGVFLRETTETDAVFRVAPGEQLVIEIFDDPADEPEAAHPGRITLWWYPVANTVHYRIEEYASPWWVQRAIVQASGQSSYRWQSRFLEDCQVHHFRVVPVGSNGNDGTPLELSALVVRIPDVPAVNYSYWPPTGAVTLTEQ